MSKVYVWPNLNSSLPFYRTYRQNHRTPKKVPTACRAAKFGTIEGTFSRTLNHDPSTQFLFTCWVPPAPPPMLFFCSPPAPLLFAFRMLNKNDNIYKSEARNQMDNQMDRQMDKQMDNLLHKEFWLIKSLKPKYLNILTFWALNIDMLCLLHLDSSFPKSWC